MEEIERLKVELADAQENARVSIAALATSYQEAHLEITRLREVVKKLRRSARFCEKEHADVHDAEGVIIQ